MTDPTSPASATTLQYALEVLEKIPIRAGHSFELWLAGEDDGLRLSASMNHLRPGWFAVSLSDRHGDVPGWLEGRSFELVHEDLKTVVERLDPPHDAGYLIFRHAEFGRWYRIRVRPPVRSPIRPSIRPSGRPTGRYPGRWR